MGVTNQGNGKSKILQGRLEGNLASYLKYPFKFSPDLGKHLLEDYGNEGLRQVPEKL